MYWYGFSKLLLLQLLQCIICQFSQAIWLKQLSTGAVEICYKNTTSCMKTYFYRQLKSPTITGLTKHATMINRIRSLAQKQIPPQQLKAEQFKKMGAKFIWLNYSTLNIIFSSSIFVTGVVACTYIINYKLDFLLLEYNWTGIIFTFFYFFIILFLEQKISSSFKK